MCTSAFSALLSRCETLASALSGRRNMYPRKGIAAVPLQPGRQCLHKRTLARCSSCEQPANVGFVAVTSCRYISASAYDLVFYLATSWHLCTRLPIALTPELLRRGFIRVHREVPIYLGLSSGSLRLYRFKRITPRKRCGQLIAKVTLAETTKTKRTLDLCAYLSLLLIIEWIENLNGRTSDNSN